MFAVVVSLLWTLGLYGLVGFNYNVLSSMIVPLVVVLAIADDVHIVQHFDAARRRGSAEGRVPFRPWRTCWRRFFGASGTTALGMASLADEQRRGGSGVRLGLGHRRDGGLRDLDRPVPTLLAGCGPSGGAAPGNLVQRVRFWPLARFSIRRARSAWPWSASLVAVVAARRSAAAARRYEPHQLLQRRPSPRAARRASSTRSSAASTRSRSCSKASPTRMRQPDALAPHGSSLGRELGAPAVRAEGHGTVRTT